LPAGQAALQLHGVKLRTMEPTTLTTTLHSDLPDNATCPVARTARIISGKWTILIIRDLTAGVKRFNQLERSLQGISPKTLSERLRSLEEEGIVLRQTFAEVPPRVEYSLTEKGARPGRAGHMHAMLRQSLALPG